MFKQLLTIAVLAALLLTGITLHARFADAGSLTPPGAPASTSVTLNELDGKLDSLKSYDPPAIPAATDTEDGQIFLSLTGMFQGAIYGDVTRLGAEDTIAVLEYAHEIRLPVDPNTGLVTGQVLPGLVTITKYRDRSTPKLYQALTTNEALTVVELKFFRAAQGGGEEGYFEVNLTGAKIVSVACSKANLETVTFTYENITWEHTLTGTAATYSASSPVT